MVLVFLHFRYTFSCFEYFTLHTNRFSPHCKLIRLNLEQKAEVKWGVVFVTFHSHNDPPIKKVGGTTFNLAVLEALKFEQGGNSN